MRQANHGATLNGFRQGAIVMTGIFTIIGMVGRADPPERIRLARTLDKGNELLPRTRSKVLFFRVQIKGRIERLNLYHGSTSYILVICWRSKRINGTKQGKRQRWVSERVISEAETL